MIYVGVCLLMTCLFGFYEEWLQLFLLSLFERLPVLPQRCTIVLLEKGEKTINNIPFFFAANMPRSGRY